MIFNFKLIFLKDPDGMPFDYLAVENKPWPPRA